MSLSQRHHSRQVADEGQLPRRAPCTHNTHHLRAQLERVVCPLSVPVAAATSIFPSAMNGLSRKLRWSDRTSRRMCALFLITASSGPACAPRLRAVALLALAQIAAAGRSGISAANLRSVCRRNFDNAPGEFNNYSIRFDSAYCGVFVFFAIEVF